MAKKETGLFLLLVLLSGLVFFFDKIGWLKTVRGWAEIPMIAGEKQLSRLRSITIAPLQLFFQSKNSLIADQRRLLIEIQRMSVDKNQLLSCQAENDKIKKLLGTVLPASWKFLPVHVVSFGQNLVLDQGEEAGIKEGMNVISENILVGKIGKVTAYSSLVQLPTSPGVKIPVAVKRTAVQARGLLANSGNQLYLDKVTQAEDIQSGDLVVSMGDEGYLNNLAIGRIGEVLAKSSDIYQKAKVVPLLNYQQLDIVFVVVK